MFGVAIVLAMRMSLATAGEIIVRDGDSIAFVGDSNTAAGWEEPSGYVRLVMRALEQEGVRATPLPAGVAGDTSERMRNRIDGVLARKPTWLTLSTGFNDVSPACGWQVGFEDFKKHVTVILDKAQAADVKVIILTPTLYGESEPDNATNRKATAYVQFLRQTAEERTLPLADLNAAHGAELARLNGDDRAPRRYLTWDGIHMGPRGNMMMAAGVLRTLGFGDDQIARAREQWLKAPYRRNTGAFWLDMTVGQFEKAEDFAVRESAGAKVAYANAVLLPLWERALVTAARAAPLQADLEAIREAAKIQFGKDLDSLLDGETSLKQLR